MGASPSSSSFTTIAKIAQGVRNGMLPVDQLADVLSANAGKIVKPRSFEGQLTHDERSALKRAKATARLMDGFSFLPKPFKTGFAPVMVSLPVVGALMWFAIARWGVIAGAKRANLDMKELNFILFITLVKSFLPGIAIITQKAFTPTSKMHNQLRLQLALRAELRRLDSQHGQTLERGAIAGLRNKMSPEQAEKVAKKCLSMWIGDTSKVGYQEPGQLA